jgi:Protein of unknown function (DUF3313)
MLKRSMLVLSTLCLLATAASAGQQPVGARSPGAPVNIKVVSVANKGANPPYDKLLIETLEVSYDSASPYRDSKPEHIARLNEAVTEAISTAVGERFTVVTEPGPRVLRVHAAISDIRAEEKRKRVLSYTPFGFVKRRLDRATGRNFVLLSATVEVELFDSVSGERLAGAADAADAGDHPKAGGDELSFRTLVAKVGGWTQRLVSQVATPDSRTARAD